jgi:hypothetical protein
VHSARRVPYTTVSALQLSSAPCEPSETQRQSCDTSAAAVSTCCTACSAPPCRVALANWVALLIRQYACSHGWCVTFPGAYTHCCAQGALEASPRRVSCGACLRPRPALLAPPHSLAASQLSASASTRWGRLCALASSAPWFEFTPPPPLTRSTAPLRPKPSRSQHADAFERHAAAGLASRCSSSLPSGAPLCQETNA